MSHTQEPLLRKVKEQAPAQMQAGSEMQGKQAPPFQLKADPIQKKDNNVSQLKTEDDKKVTQAKKKGTVNNNAADGPYGWNYGYDWREGWFSYKITIKVKIAADGDVTKDEIKKVKKDTTANFKAFWDNKFKLTDTDSGKSKPLRADVVFVDSDPHLTVNLHKGDGHDNLVDWYANSAGIVRAHELGHQLGLKDEYVDSTVPERADDTATGVHTDNSLMGNFWNEGVDTAEVKDRHGDLIANDLSASSGKNFVSTLR